MGLKFKIDEQVVQVMPPPIAGAIKRATIADNDIKYLVETPDGNQRWFGEDEIEAVPE